MLGPNGELPSWCLCFNLKASITTAMPTAHKAAMAAGTGKSSLVNALCIGLGGKPNVSRHGWRLP